MRLFHIYNSIKNTNFYLVFLILFIFSILNSYLFNWLNIKFGSQFIIPINSLPKETVFFVAIIFAPLFETATYQWLILDVVNKNITKKKILSLFISSSIFAISHYYNIIYIFATFIAGLLLGILYYIAESKNRFAFFYVFLFHALHNLYGFWFVN